MVIKEKKGDEKRMELKKGEENYRNHMEWKLITCESNMLQNHHCLLDRTFKIVETTI